jgi:hypothetical protein
MLRNQPKQHQVLTKKMTTQYVSDWLPKKWRILIYFAIIILTASATCNLAKGADINDSQISSGGIINASDIEFRTLIEFYSGDEQSGDYNWSLTFLRNGQNYTINNEIVPASLLNGTNFTVIRGGQVGQFWFYVVARTYENLSFLLVEHNMTPDGSSTNISIPLSGNYQNATVNITMLLMNITNFYVKPYFNDTSGIMADFPKATYTLWQIISEEISNIGLAIILLPIIFGFISVLLSYGLGEQNHFSLKASLIFFSVVTILPTLWIGNIVVVYYDPSFVDFTKALATLTMISGIICLIYASYLAITVFIGTFKYINHQKTNRKEEKYS